MAVGMRRAEARELLATRAGPCNALKKQVDLRAAHSEPPGLNWRVLPEIGWYGLVPGSVGKWLWVVNKDSLQ